MSSANGPGAPPADPAQLGAMLLSADCPSAQKLAALEGLPGPIDPVTLWPLLREALRVEQDPPVVAALLWALAQSRDASFVGAIRPHLSSPDSGVALAAIRSVAHIDPVSAAELLRPIVHSVREELRAGALLGLLREACHGAMETLMEVACSRAPDDRRTALGSLAQVAPTVAAPILIRMFEEESDPDLMRAQALLLAGVLPEAQLPGLQEMRLAQTLALEKERQAGRPSPNVEERLRHLEWLFAQVARTFHVRKEELESLEFHFQRRLTLAMRGLRASQRMRRAIAPTGEDHEDREDRQAPGTTPGPTPRGNARQRTAPAAKATSHAVSASSAPTAPPAAQSPSAAPTPAATSEPSATAAASLSSAPATSSAPSAPVATSPSSSAAPARERRSAPVPAVRPGTGPRRGPRVRVPLLLRAPWAPAAALGAAIAGGLVVLFVLGMRWREDSAARNALPPRPHRPPVRRSVLGAVGESITLEAEVLSTDSERGVVVAIKDRAIGVWIQVDHPIDWSNLAPGTHVVIEGVITGCRDTRNLYLRGDSVHVAAGPDG